MEPAPRNVFLLKAALQLTVAPSRIPNLLKVFDDNKHNATLLFEAMKKLEIQEYTLLSMYIGAVIGGCITNDNLPRPSFPD
jgi:hypothetical protein